MPTTEQTSSFQSPLEQGREVRDPTSLLLQEMERRKTQLKGKAVVSSRADRHQSRSKGCRSGGAGGWETQGTMGRRPPTSLPCPSLCQSSGLTGHRVPKHCCPRQEEPAHHGGQLLSSASPINHQPSLGVKCSFNFEFIICTSILLSLEFQKENADTCQLELPEVCCRKGLVFFDPISETFDTSRISLLVIGPGLFRFYFQSFFSFYGISCSIFSS